MTIEMAPDFDTIQDSFDVWGSPQANAELGPSLPTPNGVRTGSAVAGLGTSTVYGRYLQSAPRRCRRVRPRPLVRTTRDIIVPNGIPPLPDHLVAPDRWTRIAARRWRDTSEHINVKEGRVSLMSLRHVCRQVRYHHTRFLTLSDNLSSLFAFEKGRSSSRALLSLCRRAAAYQCACMGDGHLDM